MADEATMDDIINYVNLYGNPATNETFWIGLRKKECWFWNSNTPVCFRGWHKGYPKDGAGGFSILLFYVKYSYIEKP